MEVEVEIVVIHPQGKGRQGLPATTSRVAWNRCSLRASSRNQSCDTLILNFFPPELWPFEILACCPKPVCGNLPRQPWDRNCSLLGGWARSGPLALLCVLTQGVSCNLCALPHGPYPSPLKPKGQRDHLAGLPASTEANA